MTVHRYLGLPCGFWCLLTIFSLNYWQPANKFVCCDFLQNSYSKRHYLSQYHALRNVFFHGVLLVLGWPQLLIVIHLLSHHQGCIFRPYNILIFSGFMLRNLAMPSSTDFCLSKPSQVRTKNETDRSYIQSLTTPKSTQQVRSNGQLTCPHT